MNNRNASGLKLTALVLAVSEAAGAAVAGVLPAGRPRTFKQYAARTDL